MASTVHCAIVLPAQTTEESGGIGRSMKADNGRRKADELVTALYPINLGQGPSCTISEITDKFRRSQVLLQEVYDFRTGCNYTSVVHNSR